jgi:uncharacterized protein YqjF (DUF2071 family)
MFQADWVDAMFIHFAVEPASLWPVVPAELDLWDGRAIVSCVAFTQKRLRPAVGGKVGEWLSSPLAQHEFLNLRTYVRLHPDDSEREEKGIYFLSEWMPNRLAALIGPRTYGLPYHLARVNYETDRAMGLVRGRVRRGEDGFEFAGRFDPEPAPKRAAPGSIDEILVERYLALTHRNGVNRIFRIAHTPWLLRDLRVLTGDRSLLVPILPSLADAPVLCAQYSPGVVDVEISSARKITGQSCTL